jgi:4-amino-4-deoxy-L-arabinose transferase-like glycosyltransferase
MGNRFNQGALARHAPLVAMMIAAAALRAALTWQHYHHPLFRFLRLDEIEYDGYARDLIDAGWVLPYVPIHAPGYNYALAALYRLFDYSLLAPRIFNAGLGVGSAVLVYLIGRRCFGTAAGLVAALLLAFYWPLLIFEQRLLATSLYLFLYLAALLAVIAAAEWESVLAWAGAGALMGLALLVYPPAAPFPLAVAGWPALRAWRGKRWGRAISAAALLGVCVLVVMPAVEHNRRVSGEWFLLQRNGGLNFYVGNNPESDGTPYARPGGTWDAIAVLPVEAGVEKAAEQDRYYLKLVLAFARNRPAAFAINVGRKVLMIVNRFEGRSTLDPGFHRARFSVLHLPLPGLATIMVLAMPGLLALRRGRAAHQLLVLFGAVNWAVVVATMVGSRYRIVFTAFLIVLAGAGAMELGRAAAMFWRRGGEGRGPKRRMFAAAGLAALGLALAFSPVHARYSLAEEWAYLGDANLGQGHRDAAAECYRRAVAEDPNDPEALMGFARIAVLGGDLTGAEAYLMSGLAHNPKSAGLRLRLGELFYRRGEKARAIAVLEDAVRSRPQWVIGMYALAVVYADAGQKGKARAVITEIYRLRPGFDPGDDLLGKIREGEDKP